MYGLDAVPRLRLSLRDELVEAAKDYLYLLNRGYNRVPALNLVTPRYGLSRIERLALYRGVHPTQVSLDRRRRLAGIEGEHVVIDGFNAVSTVHAAMIGDTLILSTDGFVRDLSAGVRKVRVTPSMVSALCVMVAFLSRLGPRTVKVVYDSQVSRSGLMASATNRLLRAYGLDGSAQAVSKADKSVIATASGCVVCTSDSVILDRASRVSDLAGTLARLIAPDSIIDFRTIL